MDDTLRQIEDLGRSLLDRWGLSAWEFGFNRRKTAMGVCRYPHGGKPGRIEISSPLARLNTPADVKDTILHEIAHAKAGYEAGHGPLWREVALLVGAVPTACCTGLKLPQGKWQATCPSCGDTYARHRRPLERGFYYCPDCGRGSVLLFRQK